MISRSSPSTAFPLTETTAVFFADSARARQLLSAADQFAESMSPFDRSVRMRTGQPVTREDFRQFAGRCVLDWSPEESELITGSLSDIRAGLLRFAHLLPAEILLVKTTGEEEFKSAYTRQNAIVLPLNKLDYPRDRMALLIAHELFHIISGHHPALRESLYAAIGFRPCGKIRLPASLRGRCLTNLDTPATDYYIRVTFDDKPFDVMPLFFFREDRCDILNGEDIMQYLEVKFLAVEQIDGRWQPLVREGRPVLLDPAAVSGFFEQVGQNTDYNICAEEVLAENFVLLVTGKKDVSSPDILEKLRALIEVTVADYISSGAPLQR